MLRLLPQALRVNGECVLVGDGIHEIPKCGLRMPEAFRVSVTSRVKSVPVPGLIHGASAFLASTAGCVNDEVRQHRNQPSSTIARFFLFGGVCAKGSNVGR